MNAVEILRSDHQRLISVMNELEALADKDVEKADPLFQQFKNIFHQHDKAEDEIVYPALKKFTTLKRLIDKGYQAHHVVQVAILELRMMPYTSESWAPKFSVVRDSILTHMSEEEQVLFPKVTELLSADELNNLGSEVIRQREKIK